MEPNETCSFGIKNAKHKIAGDWNREHLVAMKSLSALPYDTKK